MILRIVKYQPVTIDVSRIMADVTDIEEWRPACGFEGFYEVSSSGRVRSLPRRNTAGRILRPGVTRYGHQHVSLWVNGVGTSRFVHQLVAAAFLGPRPEGLQVRHWDGDGSNNSVGNLRYGTQSENEQDKVRHGRHNHAGKTHCDSGHEFTPDNTYDNHGNRGCRECKRRVGRESAARARARARAKAA
jgi:hypothetical protein